MGEAKTKRIYTTADRDSAVVLLTRSKTAGRGKNKCTVTEVGVLLQDDRTGGLKFSMRSRGTRFDTEGVAENAAKRYCRQHPGTTYKVFGVGRREVDRVTA